MMKPLPSFTNDEYWQEEFTIKDEDNGDALTDVDEITINVQHQRSDGSSVLSGSLSGGEIVRISQGTYQWTFTADDVDDIAPQTYNVGITYELDGVTKQLYDGSVSVRAGYMD